MTGTAQRHHWLNVIVGILDEAFHLEDDEQFAVADVVNRLLTRLRIPERSVVTTLPIPVVQELYSNHYSLLLESPRRVGTRREVRHVLPTDNVVSLEAWRASIENMVTAAYPDLSSEERLLLSKVVTDLLAAIGVPNRAAAHFPPAVVSAHRHLDNS